MILTLQLDAESDKYFNDLRVQYFPPELNFINAHVTLFHNLPDDQFSSAVHELERATEGQLPFVVAVTGLRNLGRGVAFTLGSPALSALRQRVAEAFWGSLTPQDRQKFNPHITVQNKVTPQVARETLAALQAAWQPRVAQARSLQLWEYRHGPWALIRIFSFIRPH